MKNVQNTLSRHVYFRNIFSSTLIFKVEWNFFIDIGSISRNRNPYLRVTRVRALVYKWIKVIFRHSKGEKKEEDYFLKECLRSAIFLIKNERIVFINYFTVNKISSIEPVYFSKLTSDCATCRLACFQFYVKMRSTSAFLH